MLIKSHLEFILLTISKFSLKIVFFLKFDLNRIEKILRQLRGLNYTKKKSTRIYFLSLAIPTFYGICPVYRRRKRFFFFHSKRADNCTHKIRASRLFFLRSIVLCGRKNGSAFKRSEQEERDESTKKEKVNRSERSGGEGRKGQEDGEGQSRKGVREHV